MRLKVKLKVTMTLLLCVVGGSGAAYQNQAAKSGYELYSWKVSGTWHYSLVRASNRQLTKEEILWSSGIIGDDALRDELKKLPRGEQVNWMSDAPVGVTKQTAKHITGFKQPSRKRIERLRSYCKKIGIDLVLR